MSSKVPIKAINNFLVILHLTSVEETHNIFLVLSSVTLEMKVLVIFRSANSYKKQSMIVPVTLKLDQSFISISVLYTFQLPEQNLLN